MRRTNTIAAMLLALCAGAGSASAQNTARDPNAVEPPAAMKVCSIEATRWNPCSTWTWNSGHYDAVWSDIGVTATITVESFTRDAVILRRTDYGNHVGTYLYRGRISNDEYSIAGGEVTTADNRVIGHFTGTWGNALKNPDAGQTAAQSAAGARAFAARVLRQGNDYYALIHNSSTVPMTAYSISLAMYGSAQMLRHFYDVRLLGRPPIGEGAADQQHIPGIVLGVAPIAAVYADGSSFGPANEVADIMNRRVAKMAAFRAIASILCNAITKGTDKPATVVALAASKRQGGGWGSNMPISTAQMLENLRGEQFDEPIEELQRAAPSRPVSIQEVLDGVLPAARPLLADPVKDPNGTLYVQTTEDLFTRASSSAHSAAGCF
jgi:hypothetical protein